MDKQKRIYNSLSEQSLIVGCNYHTTWQSNKRMRFTLKSVMGDKCILNSNNSGNFESQTNSLRFIMSEHNKQKAVNIVLNENFKVIKL